MQTVLRGDIFSASLKKIDFAYRQIPSHVSSYWQKVLQSGEVEQEIPRPPNELNFDISIDANKKYGFAGIGCAEVQYDRYSTGYLHYVYPMVHIGNEDDLVVFKFDPQFNHDMYYEGCSGAPILDSEGNLVALVEGGDHETGKVYGVPLRQFRSIFDIECGLYG
ncbi:MAG: hypothetical protein HQL12_08885 [Candidatus Omnitrophica bacterium]|nr:hypothetical protein [Candidatus Omnitrophota bacterium]